MQRPEDLEQLLVEIRHAAWWVRHYRRPAMAGKRAAAIRALGIAVRRAVNSTDNFEPVLAEILGSLTPSDPFRDL
ncbi:MAG TPA: hypothetical protein VFB08_16555 [Burkholderiales bacterium]|nr:hypothetical protein [Burkholderiales bacterium]